MITDALFTRKLANLTFKSISAIHCIKWISFLALCYTCLI